MMKLRATLRTTVRLLAALTSIARAATEIVAACKSSIQTNLVQPTPNAVLVSSALEALKVKNSFCSCATDADCPTDFCFPDLFGGGGSTCSGTSFPCQTDADCGSTCSEVAQTADGQPIKICKPMLAHAAKKQASAVRTSWATQSAMTSKV